MKIDGRDIEDWGLTVISYEGLLNLPTRVEPTHYDWGHQIGPLLDEEDIFFDRNTFWVDFFYEKEAFEKARKEIKKYTAVSNGASSRWELSHEWGGIFDDVQAFIKDRSRGLAIGGDRGYNLFTLEGGTWQRRSFWPWYNANGAKEMADYLKGLPQGKSFVITTFDEPATRRLQGGLPGALYDCGASRQVFAGPKFQWRSAYLFMGKKGIGEGKGFEYYRGEVPSDPKAWLQVDFYTQGDDILFYPIDVAENLDSIIGYLCQGGTSYWEIQTPYKNTRAKILKVEHIESFHQGKAGRFRALFREASMKGFKKPEGLKTVGKEGLSIDGYSIEENFHLILEQFREDNTPALKESPLSLYKDKEFSPLRHQAQIHLKLSGFYSSESELAQNIEQFKALLACPGMRSLSYKGYTYKVYLTQGAQVKILKKSMAQIHFSPHVNNKTKTIR